MPPSSPPPPHLRSFLRFRFGVAGGVRNPVCYRLLSSRQGERFLGISREGAALPLPASDGALFASLVKLQPIVQTTLAYSTCARTKAPLRLEYMHMWVDQALFVDAMRASGTIEGEEGLLRILRSHSLHILKQTAFVYGNRALEVPAMAAGAGVGPSPPAEQALRWMTNVAQCSAVLHRDCVGVGETGWQLDLRTRCFVRGNNSGLIRSGLPSGWVVSLPVGAIRARVGQAFVRANLGRGGPIGVDPSMWLIRTEATLVICPEGAVDEWARAMAGLLYAVMRTADDLSRCCAYDFHAHHVVIVCDQVLASPEYETLLMHDDATPLESDHLRRFVRKKHVHASCGICEDAIPAVVQAMHWKALIVDDAGRGLELSTHVSAERRFLLTDALPLISGSPPLLRFVHGRVAVPSSAESACTYRGLYTFPKRWEDVSHAHVVMLRHAPPGPADDGLNPLQWIAVRLYGMDWVVPLTRRHTPHTIRRDGRDEGDDSFIERQLKALRAGGETCPICLERSATVMLQCGHLYCAACVRRVGTSRSIGAVMKVFERYCPTCRQVVSSGYSRRRLRNPRVEFPLRLLRRCLARGERVAVLSHFECALKHLFKRCADLRIGVEWFRQDARPSAGVVLVLVSESELAPCVRADRAVWMHVPCFRSLSLLGISMARLAALCRQVTVFCEADTPEINVLAHRFAHVRRDVYAARSADLAMPIETEWW